MICIVYKYNIVPPSLLSVLSELTHFVNVIAEELHAAQLEIILVIPAMKGGLVACKNNG